MKSFLFLLLISLGFAALPAKAQEPVYSIEHIKGDIYLFTNGDVNGVLLATKAGAVVFDPGPLELAQWLKNEIASRFGTTAKYVFYSNNDPKHFSGGPVFKDTAHYIVHHKATAAFENLVLTEKVGTALRYGNTYKVGGTEFRLLAGGRSVTLSVNFPRERIFYLADLVQVRRFPEAIFVSKNIREQMADLFYFEGIKFKIFLSGHGYPGTKEDFQAYQGYVISLIKQVFDARRRGISLEGAIQEVDLSPFKGWEFYNERRDAIITHTFQALEKDEFFDSYMKNGLVFPISRSGLKIPEKLYNKKICGWAMVEYDVTVQGKIKNVRVVEDFPTGVYGHISVESVKRYRYLSQFPGTGVRTVIFYDFDRACDPPPNKSEEIFLFFVKNR